MSFKKITAIVRTNLLESVEKALKEIGVPGVSVSQIKGYGEYSDFYAKDWMVTSSRVEVFIDTECAEGDGIVVITPVEKIYHIRTKEACIKKPC